MATFDFELNIKTINGESILGAGDVTIASLSVGTDGQIPYTNATNDDLDYSSGLTYSGTELYAEGDLRLQLNGQGSWDYTIQAVGSNTANIGGPNRINYTSGYSAFSGFVYMATGGTSKVVSIGNDGGLGARLGVKGSGNTSATTALLVQNSDGDDMLKVTDDGLVTIPRTGTSLAIRNYISIDNAPGSILLGYDASAFYFAYGINKDIHVGSGNSGDVLYKGSGNWNIAASDLGAKLGVKGSGNTSATTALVVQNSDGDDMFKVADDKAIYALTDATSNYKTKITNRGVYFSRGSDGYFNSYILASTSPTPTVTIQAAGSVHIKSSQGNNSFEFNSNEFSSPYSVRSERYSCLSNKNMLITADPAASSSNGVIVNIGSRNSSATQAIMSWKKGTYNTTTGTEIGRITPTGLSLGTTASTAFLHTAAATTAKASIRIEASASIDPTTPNSGDLWFDGTNLKFYDGTTTHNIV